MSRAYSIRKAFSKKLRETRKKAGHSVLELSRLSGISRQHIMDLERGEKLATLKTLCKLSNALNLPVWQLVYFNGGTGRCKV